MFADSAAVAAAPPELALDSLVECGYAWVGVYWKTEDDKVLDNAIQRFSSVTQQPNGGVQTVRARLGLGEVYLIRRLCHRAEAEYRAALALKPDDPYLRGVAWFELGAALHCRQDFREAEIAFGSFLSELAGEALTENAAKWKAAVPLYTRLSATDPERANSIVGLDLVAEAAYYKAHALMRVRRFRESRELARQVLAAFPDARVAPLATELVSMCTAGLAAVE